jgi:hypothetical protein
MKVEKKTTYFSKDAITCPACETELYREDLMSGSGRLIAGNLTDELRREYQPSKKFGEIFPLVYTVTVCPNCAFAALPQDFLSADATVTGGVNATERRRREALELVFPSADFTEPRDLREGVAACYLAVSSYDHFPKLASPTIKQGLCSLRAAWLLEEMHRKASNENWDYLALLFYRKARFFYQTAVDKEQTGKEPLGGLANFGPDLDHNYGYDGVLYLAGLLEFKYGPRKDPARRITNLERARRVIGRVHGMGRASKLKPTPLLERVHELFDRMTEELKALADESGGTLRAAPPDAAGGAGAAGQAGEAPGGTGDQ